MEMPHSKRSGSSDILSQHYTVGKTLGIGSFGKVKLAEHILTGKKVAIKILNLQKLEDKDAKIVNREIQVLGAFSHPHIIRLYEVIEMKSKIYLIMEYMNSGELYDYVLEMGRRPEDEARYIFQQIISGVEFCHLNMVVHRDLKPENLLLDSKHNVKLADFGLSNKMCDGQFLKTCCGSPNYAAPEILSGELYAGPNVDIWSCGVILYVLLCGRLPFDAENIPNLFKKIKGGLYTLPNYLSPGAKDLIARILVVDPMARITISEMRKHPWFQANLPQHIALPAEEIRKRVNKACSLFYAFPAHRTFIILIDDNILQEVTKIGFSRNHVIESLQNRMQNQATVAYYLLLDKSFPLPMAYVDRGLRENSGHGTSSSQAQQCTDNARKSPTLQALGPTNWTVGIQSSSQPPEIMKKVQIVLQMLNVCWKNTGQHNLRCRWLPGFISGPKTAVIDLNLMPSNECNSDDADEADMSENGVKFDIQLYMSSENQYFLDLQRVSGQPILFLEFCNKFITQLQVL